MAISLIGNIGQYLTLLLGFYVIAASLLGAYLKDQRFVESGRRGVIGVGVMLSVSAAALVWALLAEDYGNEYVYSYSNHVLPLFYKITAFWAGQKGSLLFWGWLIALFGMIVALWNKEEREEPTAPWVYIYTMAAVIGFTLLTTFVVNPFERIPIQADGRGLNPLLQNIGMVFHPPTLFIGYAGFTIPFAYALAYLTAGRIDATWIKRTRFWSVLSWIFLTIGIVLGGWWAYVELGWGGYWAWDPVENSSFMPWLTATAFVHSVMIQERKRMMKIWNVILLMLTFTLCIVGTFITRSGVIQSVHTFPESPLGKWFLLMIGVSVGLTILLIGLRWRELRKEGSIEILFSKEGAFLANDLIFSLLTLSVFMGTLWPAFTELFAGQQISLKADFFNTVNIPIFLVLLALMAFCPFIGWQRASLKSLLSMSAVPGAAMVVTAAVAVWKFKVITPRPLIGVALIAFAMVAVSSEFWRGARARAKTSGTGLPKAFFQALNRNRRRYGGYIVHFGIFLTYLGIIASSTYKAEKIHTVSPGQTFQAGRYQLMYQKLEEIRRPDFDSIKATIEVRSGDSNLGMLTPERRFYHHWEEPSAEISVLPSLREDLYVVLAGYDRNLKASFRVTINPLINWIWIGGVVIVIGGLWALAPHLRRNKT